MYKSKYNLRLKNLVDQVREYPESIFTKRQLMQILKASSNNLGYLLNRLRKLIYVELSANFYYEWKLKKYKILVGLGENGKVFQPIIRRAASCIRAAQRIDDSTQNQLTGSSTALLGAANHVDELEETAVKALVAWYKDKEQKLLELKN